MSDLCLTNNMTNEMHFPVDNSVCRVETTCPLVRLDNLVAFSIKLMRCIFLLDNSDCRVKTTGPLVQVVKSIFPLSCHVDSLGHD